MVTSEAVATESEVTIAEELTGFHKLEGWDLEVRRSLPDKVQDACRKTLRGAIWTGCRRVEATGSSTERPTCVVLVAACREELIVAL